MEQFMLLGIKINELLERMEQLIDKKIEQLKPGKSESIPSSYLTRREVATLLKISLPTLNEWTKLGWLKSYKIRNRVLYLQSEVEQAISNVSSLKCKRGG